MTEISFLTGELIFTGIWVLCRVCVWIKQRKIDRKREALLLLMYVNLAVIIRFTFFPMARVNGAVQPLVFDAAAVLPLKINLTPFVHLDCFQTTGELLLNVIGNVCMFIPTGIILPILYKRLDSFLKTAAAGALLSLCIEIVQLPFCARTSDIDDLILNSLGVMIGYGIYALVKKMSGKKPSAE